MSSKQNKNKKRFHFPKRSGLTYILLFLIPIIIFFLIAIPVVYVNNYNKYKLQIFPDQLKDVSEEVIYTDGKMDAIPDFNFVLFCDNYSNSSEKNTIKFTCFAFFNDQTLKTFSNFNQNNTSDNNWPKVTIRLQMNCNWIEIQNNGVGSSAPSIKIAKDPKSASTTSSFRTSLNINNIPQLPKKGDLPFIKINSIPLYAYVKYTVKINGEDVIKHYVLKYEYKDYVVDKLIFNEGTPNEASFGPTNGGI